MAKNGITKIQVHSAGVRALLQSAEVQADLTRRAEAIQQATGSPDDYDVDVKVREGSSKLGRVMAYVTTSTPDGRRAEAEDRALTRAIDGGR